MEGQSMQCSQVRERTHRQRRYEHCRGHSHHVLLTWGWPICANLPSKSEDRHCERCASHQTNGLCHLWIQDHQAVVHSTTSSDQDFALEKALVKSLTMPNHWLPTSQDKTAQPARHRSAKSSTFLTSAYVPQISVTHSGTRLEMIPWGYQMRWNNDNYEIRSHKKTAFVSLFEKKIRPVSEILIRMIGEELKIVMPYWRSMMTYLRYLKGSVVNANICNQIGRSRAKPSVISFSLWYSFCGGSQICCCVFYDARFFSWVLESNQHGVLKRKMTNKTNSSWVYLIIRSIFDNSGLIF